MHILAFGLPEVFVFVWVLIQLAWYVGVIALLYKIWQKVKHLPSAATTR